MRPKSRITWRRTDKAPNGEWVVGNLKLGNVVFVVNTLGEAVFWGIKLFDHSGTTRDFVCRFLTHYNNSKAYGSFGVTHANLL